MKLSTEKIKDVTLGVEEIEERDDGVHFYRFTKEERRLYDQTPAKAEYAKGRLLSTSSVTMEFITDATAVEVSFLAFSVAWVTFFTMDFFADGKFISNIKNHVEGEAKGSVGKRHFPEGDFEGRVELPEGEKRVRIVFPWNMETVIKSFELVGATFVTPIKKDRFMIAYGDSITHGYFSERTSNSYITRLADSLGAELINKGIGGETFFPNLTAIKNSRDPDIITVAYGTNDWNRRENYGGFISDCGDFYKNLSENYPKSQIFAITPIWRADMDEERPFGKFSSVSEGIFLVCRGLKNVKVVDGFDFVPHSPDYFEDLRLHPNDAGFDHYFNNLRREIGKHL